MLANESEAIILDAWNRLDFDLSKMAKGYRPRAVPPPPDAFVPVDTPPENITHHFIEYRMKKELVGPMHRKVVIGRFKETERRVWQGPLE